MYYNLDTSLEHEILEPFEVAGGGLRFVSDLANWNFKMHLSHGALLHLSWFVVDLETSNRIAIVNMDVRQEELGLWRVERFTMENNLGDLAFLQPHKEYIDYHLDVEDAIGIIKGEVASDFAAVGGLYSTWGRMARHFGYDMGEDPYEDANFKKYVAYLEDPDIQSALHFMMQGDYDRALQ